MVSRSLRRCSQERLPCLPDATIRGRRPRRVAALRLLDGGDAPRARRVRGRPQRRALGPEGVDLRVRDGGPEAVWPDRFGVDIKTTPFLGDIFRRLVAICLKHGAVPIGGMATALPSHDPEVNRVAGEAIRSRQGVGGRAGLPARLGRAHLPHEDGRRPVPARCIGSGWKPTPQMADPAQLPGAPRGARRARSRVEGTRRNARMLVEYVEGWLNGRGAKGIDSLAGKPGRPSRPDGGPRHRPHVDGADRAARAPST